MNRGTIVPVHRVSRIAGRDFIFRLPLQLSISTKTDFKLPLRGL